MYASVDPFLVKLVRQKEKKTRKRTDNNHPSFDRRYLKMLSMDGSDKAIHCNNLYKLGYVLELIRKKSLELESLKTQHNEITRQMDICSTATERNQDPAHLLNIDGEQGSRIMQTLPLQKDSIELAGIIVEKEYHWTELCEDYMATADVPQRIDIVDHGLFLDDDDEEVVDYLNELKAQLTVYNFGGQPEDIQHVHSTPTNPVEHPQLVDPHFTDMSFFRYRFDVTISDLESISLVNGPSTCRQCRDEILRRARQIRNSTDNVKGLLDDAFTHYIFNVIRGMVTPSDILSGRYCEVSRLRDALLKILTRHHPDYISSLDWAAARLDVVFEVVSILLKNPHGVSNAPVTTLTDRYKIQLIVFDDIMRYAGSVSFKDADPDLSASYSCHFSHCSSYLNTLRTWFLNKSYTPYATVPSAVLNGLILFGRSFYHVYGSDCNRACNSGNFHFYCDYKSQQRFLVPKSTGDGRYLVRLKVSNNKITEFTVGLLNVAIFKETGHLRSRELLYSRENELIKYGFFYLISKGVILLTTCVAQVQAHSFTCLDFWTSPGKSLISYLMELIYSSTAVILHAS